jgi:hypothetical protein
MHKVVDEHGDSYFVPRLFALIAPCPASYCEAMSQTMPIHENIE